MVLNAPITLPTNTTPDTDNDTPPRPTQPLIRQCPFTNGTVKAGGYRHHHHHQPPPFAAVIYRECLKNHAASSGSHVLDGCGEFMPSADANRYDPASLSCAACGCHRNFHRRVLDESSSVVPSMAPHFINYLPHPQQLQIMPHPPQLSLLAAAEDDHQVPNQAQQQAVPTPMTPSDAKSAERRRKRFRTKFTLEQKEKMQSFAESLGWKLQKRDKATVENFCSEIQVRRGVFKVWMHNNKNTFGSKKDSNDAGATNEDENTSGGGGVMSHRESLNNNEGDDACNVAGIGNGSSPSG